METLDYLILIACLSAAIGGFRLGFVARVTSWIGMAIGFVAVIFILPHVLSNSNTQASSGRLSFIILLLLAGLLLGQMVGLLAGSRISAVLPPGPFRIADRIIGSIAGVLGVFLVLWMTIPTAANVPGWSAQQVHSSSFAQAIANDAPSPPDIAVTLQKLVGKSDFPSVFSDLQPTIDTGPPPESVSLPKEVIERVQRASYKVEGQACHRTQDGSGFAIGPNLIATNAHVVAGEKRTTVIDFNGSVVVAQVVLYDPARDLALLEVAHSDVQPLTIGNPNVGDDGAVFGHPGGQASLAITPAGIHKQIVAVGRDLYDRQNTSRHVLLLASALQQGDSGGAVVNKDGQVVGVAFAIAPDKPGTSYALSSSELRAVLAQPHDSLVSTQGCVSD